MENIKNIKHNLENVVLLYQSFRFDDKMDSITVEYEDPENLPVKELQKKLRAYFLNQRLDTINISPLDHLDLDKHVALYSSFSAFRRISKIIVDGKKKLISFKYSFLTSVERAESALKLLENNAVDEFKQKFPELTELALYDQVDNVMILLIFLEEIVILKNDTE